MMKKEVIAFESMGVDMPALDYDRVRRWIKVVARGYGFETVRLLYTFMNDEEMLAANNEYLGHDFYTDIITFDYTRPGRMLGEMLISLDRVRDNAASLRQDYDRELLRVVIHGVLHLCGIDDKGPGERQIMEAAEEKALRLYQEIGNEI